MRTIIVDIDNTLWDLAPVLYRHLKAVAPEIPSLTQWTDWDFWKGFISEKSLYAIIRDIHMHQDQYGVYQEAKQFLASLKEKGLCIIIAGHREKGTLDATVRWLQKHNLSYDEVHLSHDKSVLFDGCWAIVDDSPITLEKATKAGIVGVGLRTPWNEKGEFSLFDGLVEIYNYLSAQCSGPGN